MWLLRAKLNNDVETGPRMAEIMFSCAACANCVEHCVFPKFKSDLLNAFIAGRSELVNEGVVPPAVRDYFKAIQTYGNPYKLPEDDRGKWAEGLDIEKYKDQEYLFYVGCPGSYDERGNKMARAVAQLLKKLNVSFGILGSEEKCDGNEVRVMGETGLFELMAKQNIEKFNDAGVKKIIALSPHAYHSMKNEYPKFGATFQVQHYSQILPAIVGNGKFAKKDKPLRVTFHDPCYLGRHNKDYMSPRMALGMTGGVELVEMERKMDDALCCGGGGGNFFTDILGSGKDSSSRVRVLEAAQTGADILAVACPKCAKMFEDAVKAEDIENKIKVMDIGEIMLSLMK